MPQTQQEKRNIYLGFLFAIIAIVIWSGNFIVAKGANKFIPPISLNFYRWFTAALVILPFGYSKFRQEKAIVFRHWKYFLAIIMAGIIIYNNILYLAAHYTSAINLALIGTTSTSIFSIILSAIFLKEKNSALRIIGVIICIAGVVLLLTGGSINRLIHFHFLSGDIGIMFGSLFFASYTVMVRKKPAGISPIGFLFVMFWGGSLLLLPMVFAESFYYPPVQWNARLIGVVLYIGIGASFVAYICWNAAIARIGPSRTALFGNLIPILSTYEAVLILNEKITTIHIVSALLVIVGLVISNSRKASTVKP